MYLKLLLRLLTDRLYGRFVGSVTHCLHRAVLGTSSTKTYAPEGSFVYGVKCPLKVLFSIPYLKIYLPVSAPGTGFASNTTLRR